MRASEFIDQIKRKVRDRKNAEMLKAVDHANWNNAKPHDQDEFGLNSPVMGSDEVFAVRYGDKKAPLNYDGGNLSPMTTNTKMVKVDQDGDNEDGIKSPLSHVSDPVYPESLK